MERFLRDAEDGKGFRMQTVNAHSTKVPTIRKHYSKGGSTDPFVEHPTKPGMLRKFTANEHCRIKQHPVELIEGMAETRAHEVLGQGILRKPVEALFKRIGNCILNVATSGVNADSMRGSAYALKGTG